MKSSKPSSPKSQIWKIGIGLAVSAVFIWLAVRNIDFQELGRILLRVNLLWLAAGAVFILISYFFRAMLWQELLRSQRQTRLWNLFRIITVGYFASNLLPLKIGEFIRAWLLSKKENLSASEGLATIVLERGTDMFALLFFFCLAMTLVPFERWLKLSGLAVVAIGIVFVLVVLLNYRFGGHLLDILERPLLKLPGNVGRWVHTQLGKFLEGLKLLTSVSQILKVVVFSLATWLSWITVTYFCFLSLGLNLSFAAAIFMIVVLNFGLIIPSSPGGLGVFEFMVILALARYGVGKEQALGVGFTFHMLQYLLTFVFGWIFAIQLNVSMFKLNKDAETIDVKPAEPEL
jgi:uncharacterized protein (TIRG00374 family)